MCERQPLIKKLFERAAANKMQQTSDTFPKNGKMAVFDKTFEWYYHAAIFKTSCQQRNPQQSLIENKFL